MKVGTRMSTKAFPLNYFAAMAGPVSAFKERQPLKLRQTLAVILDYKRHDSAHCG